tara:strand:- start:78 stop:707 length:630 start_codon:yes stop_codon:yes gene_type:complete
MMGNTPRVIIHLLIINVIFFFGTQVSGTISKDFLALHYFQNDKFIISQLFTHLFMHGDQLHLFFNMFNLWMFGSTLASIWGTNKFLFFYISSGLGAALFQMTATYFNIEPQAPMVGASGAIYGVLVAFAYTFPNSKLMLLFPPIPVKAKYLIPLIILGDFYFQFTSASIGEMVGANVRIAHFAHIGGAVTGFLMMWFWKNNQFNKNRWN